MKIKVLVVAGYLALAGALAHSADVKISALPAGTTLTGTEPMPAVQGGVTVKTTPTAITTYVGSHSGANPTASLGLSAINGTATTFMRSDGAPALDVSITPIWTGIHEWSLTEPRILFNQSGAGTNAKLWDIDVATNTFAIRTRSDIDGSGIVGISFTRNAASTALTGWAIPANANGTVGGGLTASSFISSSAAAPLYRWIETDQGTDLKRWVETVDGAVWSLSTNTDGDAAGLNAMTVTRGTTTNISNLSFGNTTSNPSYSFLGTSSMTVSGNLASNGSFVASSANPPYRWQETDQGTDLKNWSEQVNGAVWTFATLTDTLTPGSNILVVTRGATTAVAGLSFGNATDNPAYAFLGAGTLSTGGGISGGGNISTGSAGQVTGKSSSGGTGAALLASSASPSVGWNETDQGTGLKNWDILANGGVLTIRTLDDANTSVKAALAITRGTTTAISDLSFGNTSDNPTYNFLGTGTTNYGGGVSGARFSVTGATIPANGIYLPAANFLGFSTSATQRGLFNANGVFVNNYGEQSAGTKFTTTGCSVSASTGGATAGVFTLGANSCSVVITMNGATGTAATNGWSCAAHDRTAPAVLIGGESSSTGTTATIAIPAGAGATDVISFSCMGY